MNERQHDRRCLPPKAASGWVGLFVAGVFAFYLNYVPIHLATAAHLDDVLESLAKLAFHHGHHHAQHHDSDAQHHDSDAQHHDSDEPAPHPASDHSLTLTLASQTQSRGAVALTLFPPLVEWVAALFPPVFSPLPLVFERVRPPGKSPPGPFQPRAPPLA